MRHDKELPPRMRALARRSLQTSFSVLAVVLSIASCSGQGDNVAAETSTTLALRSPTTGVEGTRRPGTGMNYCPNGDALPALVVAVDSGNDPTATRIIESAPSELRDSLRVMAQGQRDRKRGVNVDDSPSGKLYQAFEQVGRWSAKNC